MFSQVLVRQIECPKCGVKSDTWVQFHFGFCRVQDFEVGDKISWQEDGNGGEPGHRLVVTQGWGDGCPGCGGPYAPPPVCDPGQFDIFVEEDVITHAQWATGEFDYERDAHPDYSCQYILLDDYPPYMWPSLRHGKRAVK
ncbi:hypothetical protein [Actinokineospora diospyrosa]|uniref:Uncharacterized protein n=1 Tax=Actinokineospora diospyrosa TaxID=103728 RepID=A0ABT1I535_9PSEU|nr:hypothetical protein [Actinokineospora diospyrosa]MCP2267745.1 hypothetical protein [Actinokineospora diospyrosa]